MLQVFLVSVTGCLTLLALLLAVVAPIGAYAEYRQVQAHWPHAAWVAWLYLAAYEGVALFMLMAGCVGFVALLNYPALVVASDRHWAWFLVPFMGIGSLTVLAMFCWVALGIIQRRRYGLPPRTSPSA